MEQEQAKKWALAVAVTLRSERAIAQLSQAEVSRATGISRSSYRLYEEGERQPDAVQLAMIAEAFGVRLSHLINEVERRVQG